MEVDTLAVFMDVTSGDAEFEGGVVVWASASSVNSRRVLASVSMRACK